MLRVYRRRLRAEGIRGTLRRIAADPRRLLRHARRIVLRDSSAMSNPYGDSDRASGVRFVADVTTARIETVEAMFAEAEALEETLRGRYAERRPDVLHLGRFRALYALVRLHGPQKVVETGVHDGLSAALILRALERNGSGRLVSIDLPATDLPADESPGWLVAQDLRGRWDLRLGDSRKLLPAVGAGIDLFIHDSDHSRAHREMEFRTIRPLMAADGIIGSDDDGDDLLDALAAEWGMRRVRSAGDPALGAAVPIASAMEPGVRGRRRRPQ